MVLPGIHPEVGPANNDSGLASWLVVAHGTSGNMTQAETGKVLAYRGLFPLIAGNPSATM